MRHREVDRAGARALRPRPRPAREAHAGLRPPGDLDLLPREADADPERLADRLLAGEAAGVALGRVGARIAVRLLRDREAAVAEAGVAFEGAPDPRDLDQVEPDPHPFCSIQAGSWATEDTIPSGMTLPRSTVSGRNLPVRTSTVRRPKRCAPAMSDSMSSPTIQVSAGSASSASTAAAK